MRRSGNRILATHKETKRTMTTAQHGITEPQVQVIVSGPASALEQIRTTIDPHVSLCDYSEENGMTDLDDIASEVLEQLLAHLGQNPPQPVPIAEVSIPIRAALSDAALESPGWEDDHKVSPPILRQLAVTYGAALTPTTERRQPR